VIKLTSITVNVSTVTPLWTGDAWGKNTEIKPQSILGSLRFWFEVICYASNIPDIQVRPYNEEKVDFEKFKEAIETAIEKEKNISIFEAKRRALHNLNISLPSQIFGCNGWGGFIRIKRIEVSKGCSFDNKLGFPDVIYKDKTYSKDNWKGCKRGEVKELTRKNKNYHFWYLTPYFFGSFKIKFELADDGLMKDFLYPMLNFIEKYGFIGAKNNLGYGRVKFYVDKEDISDYRMFGFLNYKTGGSYEIDSIIKELNEDRLLDHELVEGKHIGLSVISNSNRNHCLLDIIKELIKNKSQKRLDHKNKGGDDEDRHYIFGALENKRKNICETNATKIIPWINQIENGGYQCGFISLILLQDFAKEVN